MNNERSINFGRQTNKQLTAFAKASRSDADFGYLGRERAAEAFERVEREAHPAQWAHRSAFSHIVGDPVQLGPGDVVGARTKLDAIMRAIDKGGWTRNEWARLHRMRKTWQARADGLDMRFNTVGNRQGGLRSTDARHVATRKFIRTLVSQGD